MRRKRRRRHQQHQRDDDERGARSSMNAYMVLVMNHLPVSIHSWTILPIIINFLATLSASMPCQEKSVHSCSEEVNLSPEPQKELIAL